MSVPGGDARKTATPDRINNVSAPSRVSAPTRSRVGFHPGVKTVTWCSDEGRNPQRASVFRRVAGFLPPPIDRHPPADAVLRLSAAPARQGRGGGGFFFPPPAPFPER